MLTLEKLQLSLNSGELGVGMNTIGIFFSRWWGRIFGQEWAPCKKDNGEKFGGQLKSKGNNSKIPLMMRM